MTTQRIALITGGNKGIGLETGRQLGAQGVTIIIGARDAAKGKAAADQLKAKGVDARSVVLEVTNKASIDAAAEHVGREFGRLDILINNAGVLNYANEHVASGVDLGALRETFETNFFGLVAVTQAFLPLIKKSPAGRIVNLTSILGSIAEHADPNSPIYHAKFAAYDSSKAAVNMFTQHLAHELRGTSIKVNAAHPGWVKTDMGGPEAPMELVDGAKTSVALATLPDSGPSGGFYHMGVHMRW
ncbi:MAG: SDR family NAD(P)-dependent oxidoreductase [Tepidisphaera sp.]|nr:SDR family NAD(P)-dependent oxidoreductase [Tepidisphaera sp.]